MSTQEIAQVIGELVPDNGRALTQRHGARALSKAQAIREEVAPRLEGNAAYAPLWQQFQANPAAMAPALAGVLQVLLNGDAALAARLDALLAEYRQAGALAGSTQVDTGGGAFAGRDQIVHGDQVYGDQVHGDRVAGDKITVGDIAGSAGIAIGRGAQATAAQGLSGDEIAQAFAALAHQVAGMPEGVDKNIARNAVQGLEEEARKEKPDEKGIRKWLGFLADTAPDAWQVAVDTFANPIKGLSTAFIKIAERARAERKAQQG